MIGEEEVARAMYAAHMRRLDLPASIGLPWEEIGEEEVAKWIGLSSAAITAHLAALEAAGLVVVPIEPTEAMREAAWAVWTEHENRRMAITGGRGDLAQPDWETHYYQAMLSAAPPAQNGDEVKG